MALLLMHSVHVPVEAREALRAAHAAPIEERRERLESAARLLLQQTSLDCSDARELVDLPEGGCA